MRVIWLMSVVLLALSACTPLLVGGAGAGGYYVGKDKRGIGTMAGDAGITARVNARFVADDFVSAVDIDVDTYDGIVMLSGVVDSRAIANRAVELARGVEGVRHVESNLKVR